MLLASPMFIQYGPYACPPACVSDLPVGSDSWTSQPIRERGMYRSERASPGKPKDYKPSVPLYEAK